MRVFPSCVLLFLITAGISLGQVPEQWDKWVEDGRLAEEISNYEEAARLYGHACDFSAAEALGVERLTRACASLFRAYMTNRKSSEALETAEQFAAALDSLPGTKVITRVRSRILLAYAHSARGDTNRTSAALKTAVELTEDLQLIDGAHAFVEIAPFYLPTKSREVGQQMLTASLRMLQDHQAKSGTEYLRAAHALASILREDADQREDLVALLSPVVQQAQEISAPETESNERWQLYGLLSRILELTLADLGNEEESARQGKLREGWPRPPIQERGEIELPTSTKRVNPVYPRIAKSLGIRGTVKLSVEIGVDGRVRDVRVFRSVPYGLNDEAIRAVRQWRFRPMLEDGVPTPIRAQINLAF